MINRLLTSRDFKIAYYLVTDIQHIPPIIRLIPHLGGIIITKNKTIYNHILNKYSDIGIPVYLVKHRNGAKRILLKNKIRIVIYPGYNTLLFGKSIQIFHGGLSDKNYVESILVTLYNLILFPGEKTKDKIAKSGYLKYVPKWEIIGYPKFDPLINQKLNVTPIFNNNRKTILYAPTWVFIPEKSSFLKFSEYGETSINLWTKEIIKALYEKYNLIIKYHSKLERKEGDIYDQVDKLIKELNAGEYVTTRIDDNILPYMYQADLMISDISTACYEWFHFNKPIIFANPAPEHYSPSDDIRSNTYAWQAGDVINKKEEILSFVNENLQADKYQRKRNEIFKYTVFQPDGKATERQAEAIIGYYNKNLSTPYYLFLFKTWVWGKTRKTIVKIVNFYYHLFKKEKIGK